MDPDTNSIELSSQCSCEDCDTLRCLSRKHEMMNDEKNNRHSDTCIFFTRITVTKNNSKTDTAINEISPSKIKSEQKTKCEVCKKCIKIEGNLDTLSQSAFSLINVKKTSKSVLLCESCIGKINKINQQTNNADAENKSLVPKDTTGLEIKGCKSNENDTKEKKVEIDGKDTLTQQRPTMRKSKCKICIRDGQTHDNVSDVREMLNSLCTICKSYFPASFCTNSGNKDVKLSHCELTANHPQKNANKTFMNIPNNVKRNCKRCKNYIESDSEQKRCICCRKNVDSHQEMLRPICKICKAYFPRAKAEEHREINADKKTTIWSKEIQAREIKNVNSEIKQRKDIPIFTPTEIKCAGGFKCKKCTLGTKEVQRPVEKTMGLRNGHNLNVTPCTHCGMERVGSEIIGTEEKCTGKSKCEVCRRYVNEWEVKMGKNAATYKKIIPLCEFCRDSEKKGSSDSDVTSNTLTGKISTWKSKCKGCMRGTENWETTINTVQYLDNNDKMQPDTANKVTSLCHLCKKHNETNIDTDKIVPKKSNCKFCRRDVADWQVHFGRKSSDQKTKRKSSQCRFCRIDTENHGKDFDDKIKSTKGYIKYIKAFNHTDTVNNDFDSIDKIQNSCCAGHSEEVSRKSPVSYEKLIKSCDFKQSESETKVYNIQPSTLKLTAQIMNVPYEEFKESLNQKINYVHKETMKSTLSHDIINRIKEAYKACSCKVCECIIGKSLTTSDVCDCKPCDCEDCKSFKRHDFHSQPKLSYLNKVLPQTLSAANIMQDQPCGCTPCSCIRCTQISTDTIATTKSATSSPVRTYIAARVSENRHADNCTCPACHCAECERNFFSLSTQVTHEVSTGMTSSCRCEQCVDQRCRGAGGTDDCRCEMPSKAIFKPVEKDSHDYGIHRASVCHQRNKRSDCRDAIAMYATVSSNFSRVETVKEQCGCEECQCISCTSEKNKIPIKTILKPQATSQIRTIKKDACDCNACECENCSYARNLADGHFVNYKNAECNCDVCYCMDCQNVSKSIIAKLDPLTKSMGKIYYGNNLRQCTDCNMYVTGCSQAMCETKQHDVSVKAVENNNKDLDNNQKNSYNRYGCLNSKNPALFRTYCGSKHLPKQIPQQYTAADKYFENNLNKSLNHSNYRNCDRVVKGHTLCESETNKRCSKYNTFKKSGSSVSTFSGYANSDLYNEYNHKLIKAQPCQFTLSNYKADYPKTTLETCLNDILILEDDYKLKMGSKMNKPNISCNNATYDFDKNQDIDDIDVYNYMFEPLSNNHNVYNKKINNVQIYEPPQNDICHKCKIKKQSKVCIIPSVINYNNNFVKNQIDYARVHNTLREAKDFSKQLNNLLDKYERANRDFQSISEKLKLLHDSNECNKLKDTVRFQLDYMIIGKQNNIHDFNKSVIKIKDIKGGVSDIAISPCFTNYTNNHSYNRENAIILLNGEENVNLLQNKGILVEKENNENLTNDGNLEKNKDAPGRNLNSHLKDFMKTLTTTETQIVNIDQSFDSSLNTTNINEVKTFHGAIEDKDNKQSTFVDNNSDLREEREIIRNNVAQDAKLTLPCKNNTHNEIDKLTEMLSESIIENVIKNYEELAPCRVNKYDTTINSEDNEFLLKINEDGSQGSINRTNFHLKYLDFYIPPYGLSVLKGDAYANSHATSAQTSFERHLNNKYKMERLMNMRSGSSLPRNKTIQVDKESETCVDISMENNKYKRQSASTLKSRTESDTDTQSRLTMLSSERQDAMGKAKCSCELLKVGFLGGRRVSDHTVMVKWTKPKDLRNVQGYELQVDGRPVQTIIDSSRCMAVVTCLPNSDKVLLTMKTILLVATKSGHEPSVTIVYHPRLKKNKTKA